MSGVISTVIDSWLFPGCIALFLSSGRAGDTIDANEDGSGHKFSIVMIEIAPGRADIRGLF
ncbi:hypothetical protein VNPA120661_17750 [Pseudomonas aeruginosa]|nr:hypothetical protein BN889_06133 [Pseudomonas aeruginosa PA38182]BCT54975.1 hypothetical protein RVB2_57980 [Pseudomonas aeruginosa]GLE69622.1 hypothetical protein VNPA110517_34590 [Pseudomonas aeruginosa]GLE81462.1 hypothetical protein VNPA120661_17750 [Pseudomonas aeruginosa]GLF03440.1 hypothetical protein VNPA120889_35930 [Pseudomonas aeruginosa]